MAFSIKRQPQFIIKSTQIPPKFNKTTSSFTSKIKINYRTYLKKTKEDQQKSEPIINFKPKISAKSYLIGQIINGEIRILDQRKSKKNREIASLTKICTLCIACQIIKELKIDPKQMVIKIGKYAPSIIGTSAQLFQDDELTMYDLLVGMMLPSGNDAAYQIGETLGKMINHKSKGLRVFLDYMNRLGRDHHCVFTNTHGLPNRFNISNAEGIAQITELGMRDDLFREIVSLKEYQCQIKGKQSRQINWKNKNKLVQYQGNECIGVKTGKTVTAGPCLVTYYKRMGMEFIIVVLKSDGSEQRFEDSYLLYDYIIRQIK